MWHAAFIAAHAITGVIALLTGLVVLRNGRWFDVYLGSMAGMTVFLGLAIGAEWAAIGAGERVLFAAFTVLAVVMIWRAVLARPDRPADSAAPPASYVDHVGFTVVALFDAFCVIAVLNAGAPIWLVVGTGVMIAIAGHFALRWYKRLEGERRWSTG